ncbi:uncharacterized protein LOC127103850 [Lathyrus oleraceus]|uniref:uncharacterized protein LOC127103850 n=1 Tax=Pisum sativum TaxID=3888 RepID=UPI0021D2CFD9|nr:uncharacterized protein LOC127103850 [Pisum sativum]
MDFKKTDDVSRSAQIFEEELEHEEILVEEEAQDAEDTEEVEETIDEYLLARDRPRRIIKPPQRLGYADLITYALIFVSEVLDEEPIDYKEVMRSRNKTEWLKAMDDEMKSLHDNHTWELIKKPVGASWETILQKIVSLSTTEAEYIILTGAVKEALCLEGFAKELKLQGRDITIKYDSQSVIYLSKNSAYHERTKHIDVRLHFVRGVTEHGEVQVLKVSTYHNVAHMITKTLPSYKFFHCMQLIKLHEEN